MILRPSHGLSVRETGGSVNLAHTVSDYMGLQPGPLFSCGHHGNPVAASLRRVGASRLDDCHGWNWEPRQVDDEDASLVRQVASIDPAIVRFDAPSAQGKAEANTGSIGAALLERAEQFVVVPTRQTTTFVLDLDQHAFGAGADSERDGGMRPRELECVLEHVSTHRSKALAVSLAPPSILPGHHHESDPTGICLECCGRREFVDELGNPELLLILDALGETDLGERATNESAYSQQAAMEHPPGPPGASTIPGLYNLARDDRRVDQVSKFMSKEAEAFAPARGLPIEGGLISFAP